jgi:hypothetical protein
MLKITTPKTFQKLKKVPLDMKKEFHITGILNSNDQSSIHILVKSLEINKKNFFRELGEKNV